MNILGKKSILYLLFFSTCTTTIKGSIESNIVLLDTALYKLSKSLGKEDPNRQVLAQEIEKITELVNTIKNPEYETNIWENFSQKTWDIIIKTLWDFSEKNNINLLKKLTSIRDDSHKLYWQKDPITKEIVNDFKKKIERVIELPNLLLAYNLLEKLAKKWNEFNKKEIEKISNDLIKIIKQVEETKKDQLIKIVKKTNLLNIFKPTIEKAYNIAKELKETPDSTEKKKLSEELEDITNIENLLSRSTLNKITNQQIDEILRSYASIDLGDNPIQKIIQKINTHIKKAKKYIQKTIQNKVILKNTQNQMNKKLEKIYKEHPELKDKQLDPNSLLSISGNIAYGKIANINAKNSATITKNMELLEKLSQNIKTIEKWKIRTQKIRTELEKIDLPQEETINNFIDDLANTEKKQKIDFHRVVIALDGYVYSTDQNKPQKITDELINQIKVLTQPIKKIKELKKEIENLEETLKKKKQEHSQTIKDFEKNKPKTKEEFEEKIWKILNTKPIKLNDFSNMDQYEIKSFINNANEDLANKLLTFNIDKKIFSNTIVDALSSDGITKLKNFYWSILGFKAEETSIINAFKNAAKKFHPDTYKKNILSLLPKGISEKVFTAAFKKVNNAKNMLKKIKKLT